MRVSLYSVTISLPAEVVISEGVAGGTVQVCAQISGGSADATITSTINATLDSSPGNIYIATCVNMQEGYNNLPNKKDKLTLSPWVLLVWRSL